MLFRKMGFLGRDFLGQKDLLGLEFDFEDLTKQWLILL
jgi:hypothetical protein